MKSIPVVLLLMAPLLVSLSSVTSLINGQNVAVAQNNTAPIVSGGTLPQLSGIQGAVTTVNATNTSQLKIITHNVNNCRPQSSCANIISLHPYVDINTFEGNQYRQFANAPGSELGRIVNFKVFDPQGIQYDVSQEAGMSLNANVTTQTSVDCQGIMHAKDHKVCVITNYIYSTPNPLGQLKIITHNVNNCRPQSSCPTTAVVDVYTFENNVLSPFAHFPGSEKGRIVSFDFKGRLRPVQYDVSATLPTSNVTIHRSPDCEGIIYQTDNKVCTIDRITSNQMNNTSAISTSRVIQSQSSNVTSSTK